MVIRSFLAGISVLFGSIPIFGQSAADDPPSAALVPGLTTSLSTLALSPRIPTGSTDSEFGIGADLSIELGLPFVEAFAILRGSVTDAFERMLEESAARLEQR